MFQLPKLHNTPVYKLAKIAAAVWQSKPLARVESGEGVLILGVLGQQTEAVFVYREETDVAATLLLTLPELVLCHLKIRNSAHNLSIYLPAAKRHDLELRRLMDWCHPNRMWLAALWEAGDQITTERAELAATVADIEGELRTLDLNRRNFETAIAASPFAPAAVELTELLIDRWSTPLAAQANADLGYRIATRERAVVEFESLNTTINWHVAWRTGWLTVVVLVLTLIQAAAATAAIWQFFSPACPP